MLAHFKVCWFDLLFSCSGADGTSPFCLVIKSAATCSILVVVVIDVSWKFSPRSINTVKGGYSRDSLQEVARRSLPQSRKTVRSLCTESTTSANHVLYSSSETSRKYSICGQLCASCDGGGIHKSSCFTSQCSLNPGPAHSVTWSLLKEL